MKVYILYPISASPAGGGNQFLRTLGGLFSDRGLRADSAEQADVILFNSHQFVTGAARLKRRSREKIFVHRVDGPMRLYNRKSDTRDFVVNMAAQMISDGTVFQSEWSRKANYDLGLYRNRFDIAIYNAVDPSIFNPKGKAEFTEKGRVRLIATSWSPHPNKGFDIYRWLDRNLDFSRFEMTFVGNSPEVFQNIRHKKPMSSEGLAREIRAHDIHVFASRMEACSNSLLEALQCGLPALAPNVSSNPEVLGTGGELFERAEEIPGLLNRIVERYSDYQKGIKVPSIEGTADRYLNFMRGIHEKAVNGEYRPKSLGAAKHTLMLVKLLTWRIYEKLDVLGGRAAPGVYDS